jgi:hypothetical protein
MASGVLSVTIRRPFVITLLSSEPSLSPSDRRRTARISHPQTDDIRPIHPASATVRPSDCDTPLWPHFCPQQRRTQQRHNRNGRPNHRHRRNVTFHGHCRIHRQDVGGCRTYFTDAPSRPPTSGKLHNCLALLSSFCVVLLLFRVLSIRMSSRYIYVSRRPVFTQQLPTPNSAPYTAAAHLTQIPAAPTSAAASS